MADASLWVSQLYWHQIVRLRCCSCPPLLQYQSPSIKHKVTFLWRWLEVLIDVRGSRVSTWNWVSSPLCHFLRVLALRVCNFSLDWLVCWILLKIGKTTRIRMYGLHCHLAWRRVSVSTSPACIGSSRQRFNYSLLFLITCFERPEHLSITEKWMLCLKKLLPQVLLGLSIRSRTGGSILHCPLLIDMLAPPRVNGIDSVPLSPLICLQHLQNKPLYD